MPLPFKLRRRMIEILQAWRIVLAVGVSRVQEAMPDNYWRQSAACQMLFCAKRGNFCFVGDFLPLLIADFWLKMVSLQ